MRLNPNCRRHIWAWFSAAGFVALGAIGCNSDHQAVTAQNSKYQVDDSAAPAAAAPAANNTDSFRAPDGTPSPVVRERSASSPRSKDQAAATAQDPAGAAASEGRPTTEAPPRPSSTPPPGVQSASAQVPAQPLDRNDPAQMVAYLNGLLERRPSGTTREEAMTQYEVTQNEIIEIANAILAMQADSATKKRAAEGKIQALSLLEQLGRKEAKNDLRVFLTNLGKSEVPDLARLGKRMLFAQQMDAFPKGGSDADSAKLVKEFETLLADDNKDAGLFYLGNQVASLFLQQDKKADALAVMKLTRDAYAGHSDPEIASAALSLGEQLGIVALDVNSKLTAYLKDEPNSEQALLAVLDQVISAPGAGETTFGIVRQRIAPMLESRNLNAAAHVYEKLRAAYEKHPDSRLANEAVTSADRFTKRKAIVGQPFVVEGLTLAGAPLDWSKYKGKVVLIDFWATWCGPCLEEIPNIKANYDQYHDQGFEVVGVNLDDDMQSVQKYFSFQKVPWMTVVSPDPNRPGMANPLAEKCGIETIPFLVLVGRDGKAIALNTRGEELGEKLAELFPSGAPAGAGKVNQEKANPGKATQDKATQDKATQGKNSQAVPRRPMELGASFVSFDTTGSNGREQASKLRSFEARSIRAGPGHVARVAFDLGDAESGDTKSGEKKSGDAKPGDAGDTDDSNPYLAPAGLSAKDLVEFLLNMQEKPQSIQRRPGFSAAIVEAADRVLEASGTSDKQQRIALLAKVAFLHRAAEGGDPEADKQLAEVATRFQADTREEVAREVRFIRAEQAALGAAKLPREEIPAALETVRSYLEKETLSDRHLRMASSIVEAINRLSDEDFRENRFQEFGKLFAKSESKELTRYGNRLSEAPEGAVSKWVGKPIELTGTTVLGTSFDWVRYRGKVVVVDFWATWCGPCRAEMPLLKAFHEKFATKGFDVVGVSVDRDTEALAKFLSENEFPWTTLAGQDAMEVARRLGVRGLPTMLVVDQQGKVVSLAHSVAELAERVESLLAK